MTKKEAVMELYHQGLKGYKCAAEELAKALALAIEMIEDEFCSHHEPHSENLETCYAQDQLKSLAAYSKLKEQLK